MIELGWSDVHRQCSVLTHYLVSGHGVQIKDKDGDESDGLDECLLLCLLLGILVTNENGISQAFAPWTTAATIHTRTATPLG